MASINWDFIWQRPVGEWLYIAIKANNEDLFQYVLDRKEEVTDDQAREGMEIACTIGHIRFLRRMIDAGVGKLFGGLLSVAILFKQSDIISYLETQDLVT